MKIIDMEKGRILGVNLIDLIVILVILGGVAAFAYYQRPVQEKTYAGFDIGKACTEYTWLSKAGFLVEAEIYGKWNLNKSPCHVSGLISSSEVNRLYVILKNGEVVSVGGSQAYIEDIAAEKIIFKPLSSSTVKVVVKPVVLETIGQLKEYLENISKTIAGDYQVATVTFTGLILIDSPGTMPSTKNSVKIWIQVNKRIILGDPYISVGEEYITVVVKGQGWRLQELVELDKILEELGFPRTRVSTGEITLFIGTKKSLTDPAAGAVIQRNAKKISQLIKKEKITIAPKP